MGISWTTAPSPAPRPPPPSPWMPRPVNPCVMYHEIDKTKNGEPGTKYAGAWGYVKCRNGTTAPGCASFGPAAKPCSGADCTMLPLGKQSVHTGFVFSGQFTI